ncbi:SMC family ATPase [bacterium]|nr:SMC family ATPase [bacterium]MBT3903232.1 SMC family ATPase [bacterium]MBT4578183.1 SMC family ATPase [bacterium]MBT5345556.1 SMC family ATPase [bacterium]MBT6131085.1 SMC family ATPase [bacterium]
MIPLRIQIRNFLSYGSELQTIDFSHYPLICLSGKNGHGKSALLDALTWALWGHARKAMGSIKADQSLLRLGQKQMMVILDFEFNSQRYRIRREFSFLYGKPHTRLDFGIMDTQTDTLRPLTDTKMKETQEKIKKLIGLDFDTFSNTAFLRQGQANQFSKKSPKERKQLIGSILGLGRYETIRKRCLEHIRTNQAHKQSMELSIERTVLEQEKRQESLQAYSELAQQIKTNKSEQKAIVKQLEQCSKDKQKLDKDYQQCQLITFKHEQAEQTLEAIRLEWNTISATWRSVHKATLAHQTPAKLQEQKKSINKKIQTAHKDHQTFLKLSQELLELEKQFNQEQGQQELAQEKEKLTRKAHERAITDLTLTHSRLKNELEQSNTERKDLEEKQKEDKKFTVIITQQKELFERRRSFYHNFVARKNTLTTKITDLEKKQSVCKSKHATGCPLCEQNLSSARRRFLNKKFEQEKKLFLHQHKRLLNILIDLKELLLNQHETIKSLDLEQQQLAIINKRIVQLDNKTKELTTALKQQAKLLSDEQKKYDSCSKKLPNKPTALISKLKKQIESAQKKQAKVANAHETYKTLGIQLNKLEKSEQDSQELLKQSTLQEERRKRTNELLKQIRSQNNQIKKLKTLVKGFEPVQQKIEALDKEQKTVTTKQKDKLEEYQALLTKQAEQKGLELSIEQLKKDNTFNCNELDSLVSGLHEYQAISRALSKDGIQALLIEDALPEIEQEANNLLGRLTDNQTHIRIESLKDLKKGGTKETLDIVVSDPMGTRPYELFSGGEAFRIDFALRIAISKLLARRAGTALQTLIIDEGFGSQDEQGLTRIMDAIYKIQDDFCKVIVVSHLPAIKDQFPVHFHIHKGPRGSTVRVVEQG